MLQPCVKAVVTASPMGRGCVGTGLRAFCSICDLCRTQSAAVGSCGMREEMNKPDFGKRNEGRGGGSGKMTAALPSAMQLGGWRARGKQSSVGLTHSAPVHLFCSVSSGLTACVIKVSISNEQDFTNREDLPTRPH